MHRNLSYQIKLTTSPLGVSPYTPHVLALALVFLASGFSHYLQMPKMPDKPLAVIVGAGIAGLAAAWWLDKIGWKAIIIEKASDLQDGGYVMTLSGPCLETLQKMEIKQLLGTISQQFEYNTVKTYSGYELYRLRYSEVHGGMDSMSVRRNDLARMLLSRLPSSSEIKFSRRVVSIQDQTETVKVQLDDGHTLHADLVIGADGVRSQVRDMVFEQKDALDFIGLYFAAYNFETGQEPSKNCVSFNRPGQLDMVFSLKDGGMTGYHIWAESRGPPGPRGEGFKKLRELTADSQDVVRNAVRLGEAAGTSLVMDSANLVVQPRWSKGRVLLLGDAAHCLTLMSGQGAGMALVSAEMLSQELSRTHDVGGALAAHESRLRPGIERLQRRSRELAAFYVPRTWLQYFFRNLLVWLMPRKWLVDWHVKSLFAEIETLQDGGAGKSAT